MKKFTPIIVSVLLALICRIYLVAMFKVPGQTMAPTLVAGDYVLGTQLYSHPAPGELIVFVKNNKTFIKRVIAVAGDEAEYRDGALYLNGAACEYSPQEGMFDASFVLFRETCKGVSHLILQSTNPAAKAPGLSMTRIQPGEFLVASDNRDSDTASSTLETIKSDQIVGKPLLIWMSYSSTQDFISKTSGVRWNRILTILR